LDKFQDDFCRLPLKSTNLLVGSPGTGKTTSLIKRLVYKSDLTHLIETDEIELENDKLKSWVMFTPNELLKSYLKEAMNKEGLLATDTQVITWEKERDELGRDVLKFLKTNNSGRFSPIKKNEILTTNTSSDLIEYTTKFIEFFSMTIQDSFSNAIKVLERNKPEPDIISKDNFGIAQNFNEFTNECKLLFEKVQGRKISDDDYKTLQLIEGFQAIKPQLLNLRSQIRTLVDKILNNLIATNPQIIEKVSEIILARDNLVEERDENVTENEISLELEEDEVNETEQEEIDLRIQAKRQIRSVIIKHSESLALDIKVKNKNQLLILEMILPLLTDENTLEFLGKINISLRQRIFSLLDYSRILDSISLFYDKFRLKLIKNESAFLNKDGIEFAKKKKISHNEIDVLIYVILRFAEKIFSEKRNFLEDETNFDLLENIKTCYRTQIAVDETSDFSAIQLGCMYHLAHPKYKSVSFSGDLMQRVTGIGVSDWKECDFFSNKIRKRELRISYRQTPTLLKIASKLYKNIIGQEPPFKSSYSDVSQDPKPLKFKVDGDEDLSEWIVNRISEIYKINGEQLPSIAIFVPEENDIDSVYEAVHEQLYEVSIDVEKCKEGKVLGTGSKVRIFSVEFIKGLEFEGVFLIGIDDIYKKSADLLDKYLYVGLTRATTFLGVTYKEQFPVKSNFLKNLASLKKNLIIMVGKNLFN
jgi:uncharacterized ubiquitin-like protein YukD